MNTTKPESVTNEIGEKVLEFLSATYDEVMRLQEELSNTKKQVEHLSKLCPCCNSPLTDVSEIKIAA